MKRVQIEEGVYQFGKQVGTADLPDFLRGFDHHKAPHVQRSKWQRKMVRKTATVSVEGKSSGFYPKTFQPNTTPVQFKTRRLSAKQQAKQQADHAAIMAMRKH